MVITATQKRTAILLLAMSSAVPAQTQRPPQNSQAMALHYGHGTPPISPVTDMEDKTISIEPFKGHWTLLYFWTDWCVPCVKEGIPALITFASSHRQERNEFRIVAIRFNPPNEAGDWNDFHAKTTKLENDVWHATPAFPVVYDATTRMTSDWGIHELPTYALIDPQGNLVQGGNLSMLRAIIDGHKAPS